ncbi:MAG: methyltransferase family protein [Gemmatimonadales bacterium]
MIIALIVPVLWITWLIYWAVSARDVKATRWRESRTSQVLYRVPVILVALLMAAPSALPRVLTRRFVPAGGPLILLGPLLVAAGLGLAVWARRHLGRNWSTSVVVKEDHTLIRSGPYRHVRHPIYTGILLAFLGTALWIGEWRGLLAVPLMVLSFVLKSRAEERRMRETFPEYQQYERDTAALVPFVY